MSLPYMPLYVGDYLKDTRHLTTEQHGAYLLLLMDIWNGDGELPNAPKALSRIAGVSPKRWPLVWSVIGEFFSDQGATLRHKRVDLELQKADQISQKRRNAGSAGGRAKALNSQGPPLANAKQMPSKRGARSEPQPLEEKEEAKASSKKAKPKTLLPEGWQLPTEWIADAQAVAFKAKQSITEQEIENEVDSFRDHSHSKSVKHSDWRAAWRYWVRNYIKWRKPRNAPNGHGAFADGQHRSGSIADAAIRRHVQRQNGNAVPDDRGRRDDVPAEGGVIDGDFRLVS